MAKKTKKIDYTSWQQIEKFIGLAKHAKVAAAFDKAKDKKGKGLHYEECIKAGISEKVMGWLIVNHYINKPRSGQCLWIAWSNAYYPEKTIANLEKFIAKFKESEEYKKWLEEQQKTEEKAQ